MSRTPSEILPGLPDELALLCLARLPLREQARCRCVSHAFFHALRPEARRQALDVAKETWLLLCFTQDFDDEYQLSRGPIHWFLLDPLYAHCSALPTLPTLPTWSPNGFCCALPLPPLHAKVLFQGLFMNPLQDDTPPSYHLPAFDLLDRQWCSGAPPMITEDRCSFAFATLDGYLYVAGGNPNDVYGVPYHTAERFNLTSQIWECLPDMHEKRHACSGFSMDGCFYIVGGLCENGNPVLSGEFFDPKTGLWNLLPEMWPSYLASPEWTLGNPPAVAMVNHHLYALKYLSAELFWYDKQKRKWVSLGDFSSEWKATLEQRLLGMGDELWIFTGKQEGLIQVFTCKPQGGCSTIKWQSLSFQLGLDSDSMIACSPVQL